MPSPAPPPRRRLLQDIAQGLLLASAAPLLAGCSALKPSAQPGPAYYLLEAEFPAPPAPPPETAATLLVQPPRAAAGFDSQRILYLREPHRLEYFAHSEWVDPPARMLGPLLVAALQSAGAWRAVVLAPSAQRSRLQLDTQVLRLQQEFLRAGASQVRFALRASLGDAHGRRVLATRDFEAVADAPSDTPYGGVQAANAAVRAVLLQLAAFCRAVPLPPEDAPVPRGGLLR